jgi:simple sugar transport system substrate-binding protein
MSLMKLLAGCAVLAALGFESPSFAESKDPQFTVVVKIEGIPWFAALNKGIQAGGKDFNIDATMIGPAKADPAQQVRMIEDLIAKKVDAIGLVPLDVNVTAPVLARAQAAGIPVITHEGPGQKNKTWNVDLIDSKELGIAQMKSLAAAMGEKGEYVVYVGTLTTPLHNEWADAAIAYQKEHYPNMKMAGDRYPYNDSTDEAFKVTLDVLQTYPDLKGILAEGANAPVGAGNAVRQANRSGDIVIVGTALPSQVQSLIKDGTIHEAFNWNPIDSGYAMVAVAHLVLTGAKITDGMDIPGLGKAKVDPDRHLITINKIVSINKDSVDGLVAAGL